MWQSRRSLPVLTYPLLSLVFAALLGPLQYLAGWTVYPFATQTAAVKWATLLAIYLIGSCLFNDKPVRDWVRSMLLWFSFVLSVLSTLQTFSSDGKVFWLFPSGYSSLVMGPIPYRNHYAVFVEAVLPIACYRALRAGTVSQLDAGMAAALYASVVASASRAGSILATGEILVVVVLMWVRGRTDARAVGRAVLKIALLVVVFTGIAGWQSLRSRFREPDPAAMRTELATSSIRMIADRPLKGTGLGTWSTIYPRYANVDIGAFANQAHNDWLEWTAEGGIPFGIIMTGLFLWCLRPAFRTIWGLGVIAVFLHALVDYPFSRPALGSWMIVFLAMMAAESPHTLDSAPSLESNVHAPHFPGDDAEERAGA
jgi:O-antigen ligase